jgi:hypothetical protein
MQEIRFGEYEDTIKDPKGHFYVGLTMADRRARLLAKLRLSDSKLSARPTENAKRLDQMRDVLGSLEKTSASATRALGFPMIRGEMESKRDRRS